MGKNQKIIIASLLLLFIVVIIFSDTFFQKWWGEKLQTPEEGTFSFDPSDLTIYGCTRQSAENYNPVANTNQNFGVNKCFDIWGCCNNMADNYNADADSCEQPDNNRYLCDFGAGAGMGITLGDDVGDCHFTDHPMDDFSTNEVGWTAVGLAIQHMTNSYGKCKGYSDWQSCNNAGACQGNIEVLTA